MARRLIPAIAAAAGLSAFFAAPALAAATGCHKAPPCAAAVCVYVQQDYSSGACHKKPKPVHHTSTTPVTSVTPVPPPPTPPVKKPTHRVHHKPAHRKPHHRASHTRHPQVTNFQRTAAEQKAPGAVSAAFDLGSGPTFLFAGLLVAAALIALGGGLQRGRRR